MPLPCHLLSLYLGTTPHLATPPDLATSPYQALKLHPDKNPDDPEAKDMFQKASEAYQVLADEGMRAKYDMHGASGVEVNFMDAGVFFTMLFGDEMRAKSRYVPPQQE